MPAASAMPTWSGANRCGPASLFRIASISKPFTATAVLQLVEQGKLKLDERVLPLLKLEPHLERGARLDPRWHEIRLHHCLQHTAGWNRDKSFDPMSAATAEQVAKSLKVRLPIHPRQIIRYMLGKPLDFAPGTAYAYSNFGYCVLGRVIEAVGRMPYHRFVAEKVLAPLRIRDMRLGKNLLRDRAPGEVKVLRQQAGAQGGLFPGRRSASWCRCPTASSASRRWTPTAAGSPRPWTSTFRRRPGRPEKLSAAEGTDHPRDARAAAGAGGPRTGGQAQGGLLWLWLGGAARRPQSDRYTKWHTGGLAGSSTLLVCRADGIDWAVLFNTDADQHGKAPADVIDPLLHKPADEIKSWPDVDLFPRF